MKFIFATDIHLSSTTPGSRIDDYTETVFKKLEYLFNRAKEENAVVLLGGDLFTTPTQPDLIKNRLKYIILQTGVKVISIVGNHDLLYYSLEYIDRTSFKSLVSPGVIEFIYDKSIMVGDVEIIPHQFVEKFPISENPKSIVLSHTFYNSNSTDRLTTPMQDIWPSKSRYVCFGHDHNMYKVEDCNGSLIIRPGALTRGTSHTENRVRHVSFALIDTDNDTVIYENIPFALKFEEVFREKYSVEVERKPVTFDDIQRFIEELRNSRMEVDPYDILFAMNKSKRITDRCVGYMQNVGLTKSHV